MFALLLGAGFSKWAADLPVASQLFDFAIDVFGPRESRRLSKVQALLDGWNQEHPGGLTEQFVAYALSLPEEERRHVLWYVGRRLSEPFIWYQRWRRYPFSIGEAQRISNPGVEKARKFLQRFMSWRLSGIVTTNYDLLVEYALGTKLFNYGSPNERLIGRGSWQRLGGPVILKGSTKLAKIHGSISWSEDGTRYSEGRGGITGDTLIVAPAPEKHPPASLRSVWGLAENILSGSDSLLVFGFAFNPHDEAVLSLLAAAGRNLKAVLLVDIAPNIDQARKLWPDATITSCLPPPNGDAIITHWRHDIGA
ncbi:MAG: SIR2 family protein [Chloroflexota bacterium]